MITKYPTLENNAGNMIVAGKKSFVDNLTEEYIFDVKFNSKAIGIRSVYYYKDEHSLLVSHILSNRVHVLSLATGSIRWFDHHGTTVRSIQMCEHEIITASWDGKVCVTNFDTLKPRLILTEKEMGRCPDVVISPDHVSLYSYSYDSDKNPKRMSNTVRKWSIANGELGKVFKLPGVHRTGRRCGACAVHGNRLYTVSDSGHLHIYYTKIPVLISERSFNDELQTICIAPVFNLIAIAGGEGNLYLCKLSGKRIKQINKAHKHDISQLYIPPEKSDILISVSFDGRMKIWKFPDLELLASIDVKGICLWTVTVVNNLIIVGGEADDIWIYDIKSPTEVLLKGKLVISNDSYSLLSLDANSFYANNLSMMQVRKKADGSVLENQFADYLLNSACNFKLFKDLFSSGANHSAALSQKSCGFYQLTQ